VKTQRSTKTLVGSLPANGLPNGTIGGVLPLLQTSVMSDCSFSDTG